MAARKREAARRKLVVENPDLPAEQPREATDADTGATSDTDDIEELWEDDGLGDPLSTTHIHQVSTDKPKDFFRASPEELVATLEIIGPCALITRCEFDPGLTKTVRGMLEPACGVALAAPPIDGPPPRWTLLELPTGPRAVCVICATCAPCDPIELACRMIAGIGPDMMERVRLDQWGNA